MAAARTSSRGGAFLRTRASWALGASVGLLAVSLPSYEGPLLSPTGGVDCSFLLSGLVGGAVYLLLTANAPLTAGAAADGASEAAPKVPSRF